VEAERRQGAKREREGAGPALARNLALRPSISTLSLPLPPHSASGYKWINVEPLAVALGTMGWLIPASSPAPSYGGGSLFGAFTSTIGTELAKFPVGPSLDSPFWLQFVIFHVGLFVTMTLAQIGIQGRKQGYF